jgi:hypothetical protein
LSRSGSKSRFKLFNACRFPASRPCSEQRMFTLLAESVFNRVTITYNRCTYTLNIVLAAAGAMELNSK